MRGPTPAPNRLGERDGVADGGLRRGRGDDRQVAEAGQSPAHGHEAGRHDAVVVRRQDAHVGLLTVPFVHILADGGAAAKRTRVMRELRLWRPLLPTVARGFIPRAT